MTLLSSPSLSCSVSIPARPALSVWGRLKRGFTLVELLLVVAIVSILAAMVISSFSNAAQSSRNVIANQQLAVWQSALNNWVNSRLGRIDTEIDSTGAQISISKLTTFYNSLTRKQRFGLLTGKNLDGTAFKLTINSTESKPYLEPMTAEHFISTITSSGASTTAKIFSSALQQTSQWLELPAWNTGAYPTVEKFASPRVPPVESTTS